MVFPQPRTWTRKLAERTFFKRLQLSIPNCKGKRLLDIYTNQKAFILVLCICRGCADLVGQIDLVG